MIHLDTGIQTLVCKKSKVENLDRHPYVRRAWVFWPRRSGTNHRFDVSWGLRLCENVGVYHVWYRSSLQASPSPDPMKQQSHYAGYWGHSPKGVSYCLLCEPRFSMKSMKSITVLFWDGWIGWTPKRALPISTTWQVKKCWSTLPTVSKLQLCRYLGVHPKSQNN